MRKLRLELEMLVVESFATSGRGEAAGTVRAHHDDEDSIGCTYFPTCTCTLEGPSCPVCDTPGCPDEPPDSVGCTYFPTCTCTLEGPSCPLCPVEPVETPKKITA